MVGFRATPVTRRAISCCTDLGKVMSVFARLLVLYNFLDACSLYEKMYKSGFLHITTGSVTLVRRLPGYLPR